MANSEDKRPLVLVVDDDAILRMSAAEILELEGFQTLEAVDAADAISIIERTPSVRILFTDVNMPGALDGLDLSRVVHERWPEMLLLVTSAHAHLNDQHIPDDGKFVAKPYTDERLVSHVRTLLARGHG